MLSVATGRTASGTIRPSGGRSVLLHTDAPKPPKLLFRVRLRSDFRTKRRVINEAKTGGCAFLGLKELSEIGPEISCCVKIFLRGGDHPGHSAFLEYLLQKEISP